MSQYYKKVNKKHRLNEKGYIKLLSALGKYATATKKKGEEKTAYYTKVYKAIEEAGVSFVGKKETQITFAENILASFIRIRTQKIAKNPANTTSPAASRSRRNTPPGAPPSKRRKGNHIIPPISLG